MRIWQDDGSVHFSLYVFKDYGVRVMSLALGFHLWIGIGSRRHLFEILLSMPTPIEKATCKYPLKHQGL